MYVSNENQNEPVGFDLEYVPPAMFNIPSSCLLGIYQGKDAIAVQVSLQELRDLYQQLCVFIDDHLSTPRAAHVKIDRPLDAAGA